MEFGWLNCVGAAIVLLLIVPNVVYAIKNKGEKNLCANRLMNAAEQIGRFACIVLMWLPLLVWEFGFRSHFAAAAYFAGNGALLAAYWAVFALYMKKRTVPRALFLAAAPSCIFLISGLLLRHWLLVGSAVLFAVGHVYVTLENARARRNPDAG